MAWSARSSWSRTRPPSARSIRRRASGRARSRLPRRKGCCSAFLPGDVLSLCPPLVITPQEIDELFDRLGRALDRTLDWARREGLLHA